MMANVSVLFMEERLRFHCNELIINDQIRHMDV